MKNSLLLAAFVLLSSTFAVAQSTESEENERPKIVRELDRDDDKLVFEITNDMWLDLPDGVKLRGFSPGFKGYFYSDYTFGQNSNFSFAWGFGISADNVHSNAILVQEEFPNGDLGEQQLVAYPDAYEYEKNKFVTTYLELPLELRFITKGRSPFKIAAGFRVGYLLSDHQKIIDTDGKRKIYDFNDVTTWRYGLSARVGVGKIQLTGFYSLVPLIEGGNEVFPVSVGIALTPIK